MTSLQDEDGAGVALPAPRPSTELDFLVRIPSRDSRESHDGHARDSVLGLLDDPIENPTLVRVET